MRLVAGSGFGEADRMRRDRRERLRRGSRELDNRAARKTAPCNTASPPSQSLDPRACTSVARRAPGGPPPKRLSPALTPGQRRRRRRLVVDIGTDEHGKRKQITRTFDKLREARTELARVRHETGLGTYVRPS